MLHSRVYEEQNKELYISALHVLVRLSLPVMVMFAVLSQQVVLANERPISFADLAEEKTPSVVNISTTTIVRDKRGMDMPQFPEGSPFEDFFKEFEDRGKSRRTQSLGSGFIIDKDGIVVTNNHVIENAEQITVFLSDDQQFEATLVGRDEKTDIAVLKFDPRETKLVAAEFGDSDNLRVGDWVMAIGNPFGLGGTVTAGIVSARGRDIGSGPYDDYIQTDASINRGNSGGPLFNMDGEVIGINTAIFSQSGGSVGIGFAISANLAVSVVEQLIQYGRTRRGWLGVFIQEVTEDIAESLGLETATGALVSSVTEDGPAEKGGVEAGDVITAFNGKDVLRSRDLPRIVAETPVDETVSVDVIRNGNKITLNITLGELEKAEKNGILAASPTKNEAQSFDEVGLSIAPLSPALAERFDLEADADVVVVTEVDKEGPSARKGISAGDIIRRLNQSRITSVSEFADVIKTAIADDRKGVLMLIESDGQTRFVQVSFK